MYINHLPAETWNWLKMNGSEVVGIPKLQNSIFKSDKNGDIDNTLDSVTRRNIDARDNGAMRIAAANKVNITGVGPDMDNLLFDNNITLNRYEINKGDSNVIKLKWDVKNQSAWASAIEIVVKKNCKAVVFEEFESESEVSAHLAVQTKIVLEEGASINLIQLQRMGSGVTFINDIGSMQDEKSTFDLKEVIIGASKTYLGSRSNLVGDNSEFNAEVAYLVENKDKLDMNFVEFQKGKKTNSNLDVKGILRDEAFKIFRGTIDFIRGCAGSKGSELEDVLLLDDTIVNQTIPLILCDEEDVEGDHGATIGQIDDEKLFYLKSRGIKEEDIYEMLAKARLHSVISKISDEEIRNKWESFISE